MRVSSVSATFSTRSSWAFFAASAYSAGISLTTASAGVSCSQKSALRAMMSMTPLKFASAPIGSWIATGFAPRRSTIMSKHRSKLAPIRSILLTKQIRGTAYLSA